MRVILFIKKIEYKFYTTAMGIENKKIVSTIIELEIINFINIKKANYNRSWPFLYIFNV